MLWKGKDGYPRNIFEAFPQMEQCYLFFSRYLRPSSRTNLILNSGRCINWPCTWAFQPRKLPREWTLGNQLRVIFSSLILIQFFSFLFWDCDIKSGQYHQADDFLYSHHRPSWRCIHIVRRNWILITRGNYYWSYFNLKLFFSWQLRIQCCCENGPRGYRQVSGERSTTIIY